MITTYTKKQAKKFNYAFLTGIVLTAALILSPIAQVEAADALSGNFTATDNYNFTDTGPTGTTMITAYTTKTGSPVQITYYLDGVQISTQAVAPNATAANRISIDVTNLSNGTHHITANITDADGNTAKVMTLGGADNLTFTVDLGSLGQPTGMPANTPSQSTACDSQQTNLNTITTRIVKRSEGQLATIESVVTALNKYYTGQSKKLSQYDQIMSQINSDDNAVQNALIAVVSSSSISCSGDVTTQVTTFKNSVLNLQAKVKSYITDTQELITSLESM